MAEGDGFLYNIYRYSTLDGEYDIPADTLKMILVSAHTPDIDAHTGYASVSADEYGAGSGYTVGGETLTGVTTSQDNSNDRGVFDADDVTWTSLGPLSPATPSHCILYDDTHGVDLLLAYWELGTTATNGGNYTLQFSTSPSAVLLHV